MYADPPDEFDFLIPEPDPYLLQVRDAWDLELREHLIKVRDAARAEKVRLRAAKRAAEAAAAELPAS